MSGSAALSNKSHPDWSTPGYVFRWASDRWGPFDLDAAAQEHNSKCARFISPETDALSVAWIARRVWLNPPYGRDPLPAFMRHAADQARRGNCQRVVCLVPAKTDTAWFQEAARSASEIVFLSPRVRFIDPETGQRGGSPAFGSCFIVFSDTEPLSAPRVEFARIGGAE